jgi:hypothetical protein
MATSNVRENVHFSVFLSLAINVFRATPRAPALHCPGS